MNIGPENFASKKLYLTPLLAKEFPSVDILLKKYDLNKDGALDAGLRSVLRTYRLLPMSYQQHYLSFYARLDRGCSFIEYSGPP